MALYDKMRACIEACWNCRDHCQKALFHHCLAMGGGHTEQTHIQLMFDCIQVCQVSADFMTRESQSHIYVCRACAEVTANCAKSCRELGDEEMDMCAAACELCSQLCAEMAVLGNGDDDNGNDGNHHRWRGLQA